MRLQALIARPRRRRMPPDLGERQVAAVAPNVLDRTFEAPAPNRKWIADFTYVWTAEGWLYVAAVIDLFSRRVVGWSAIANLTTPTVPTMGLRHTDGSPDQGASTRGPFFFSEGRSHANRQGDVNLLKAEPLTKEQIREICRKLREQQAEHDPEMRMFVRRPPLWRRLFAKLLFYKLLIQRSDVA